MLICGMRLYVNIVFHLLCKYILQLLKHVNVGVLIV
jgi:hypothetical protein